MTLFKYNIVNKKFGVIMNKKNVLIVEDNLIVAMDIKNAIIEFGYNVTGMVSNEIDVLKSISLTEPNIIITDISLNDKKDGIEIIRSIQQTKNIPVIYLTGKEDDETVNRALSTCPCGYLIKPFNRTELKSTVKLALYKKTHPKKYENQQYKYLGLDYYFDTINKHLYYKDKIQKLSRNETKLLNLLIITKPELVTFETIECEIWEDKPITQDAIRLLISRLRKKLKYAFIETVYSYGFKLKDSTLL